MRAALEQIWMPIRQFFSSDLDMSKLERQLEMFQTWVTSGCIGIIEAVTGFGKTMVAIIAIKRMNVREPHRTTIVVVPNRNLYNDWTDREQGYITIFKLLNVKVYVVNSYTMSDPVRRCDLLVLDEVHRYAGVNAQYFNTVIEKTQFGYCMALSATLGYEEKSFLSNHGLRTIAKVDLAEAESKGWIANFHVFNIGVMRTEEDEAYYQRVNDAYNTYFNKFNRNFDTARMILASGRRGMATQRYAQQMGWSESLGYKHEWSPASIADYAGKYFHYMRERKEYLHKSTEKTKMVERILNNVHKKTIVFSENTTVADDLKVRLGDVAEAYHSNMETCIYEDDTLEHLVGIGERDANRKLVFRDIYTDMIREFAEFKQDYPHAVKMTKTKLKKWIKQRFIDNEVRVLLTAKSLDEGFDCDDIEMGVVHSAGSSDRQGIQRMGRALRTKGDKVAFIVNVYVKDSQDEVWLKRRLKNVPKSKISWVDEIDQIVLPDDKSSVTLVA